MVAGGAGALFCGAEDLRFSSSILRRLCCANLRSFTPGAMLNVVFVLLFFLFRFFRR
jgi:hypothetical protein